MKKIVQLLTFCEFFLLNAAYLTVLIGRKGWDFSLTQPYLYLLGLLYFCFFVDTYLISRQNIHNHMADKWLRLRSTFSSTMLMAGLLSGSLVLFQVDGLSRLMVFGSLAVFFVYRSAFSWVYYHGMIYLRSNYGFVKNVLLVGSGHHAMLAYNYMQQNVYAGYEVKGILADDNMANVPTDLYMGRVSDVDRVMSQYKFTEVFISLPGFQKEIVERIISLSDRYGIRVRVVPEWYLPVTANVKLEEFGDTFVMKLRNYELDKTPNLVLKRAFDVAFAATALIMLSPILLLIALLIKLESRGPVFFMPVRIGVNGKGFRVFKFRSMYEGSTTSATMSTLKNDSRVTRVGKFIRRTSLDELPQFINVLLGDMSIVGPRPHRQWLNEEMMKEVNNYMLRHYFKPGITGWAQVNGWRGTMDTIEHKLQRTNHDLWYIENWSFLLDVKIVLLTVFSKKTHQNVY